MNCRFPAAIWRINLTMSIKWRIDGRKPVREDGRYGREVYHVWAQLIGRDGYRAASHC